MAKQTKRTKKQKETENKTLWEKLCEQMAKKLAAKQHLRQ
ncbi:hypothetical protein GGR02_002874 [Anoxybacillus voinovskiensis]|uniref:Uncharacterized protein n=1 Tax=Anoxybacteroides voinovskiense TaxID=230470 RepID=A0A840DTT9_9BACL|nr:hypothetical protein [Anoxybacillus voinovskiensis]GGJ76618.1 hypothetical protein GCM10008982_27400 [Anoxybacillus voinovskiensis]